MAASDAYRSRRAGPPAVYRTAAGKFYRGASRTRPTPSLDPLHGAATHAPDLFVPGSA
jgi:hypothetical protein